MKKKPISRKNIIKRELALLNRVDNQGSDLSDNPRAYKTKGKILKLSHFNQADRYIKRITTNKSVLLACIVLIDLHKGLTKQAVMKRHSISRSLVDRYAQLAIQLNERHSIIDRLQEYHTQVALVPFSLSAADRSKIEPLLLIKNISSNDERCIRYALELDGQTISRLELAKKLNTSISSIAKCHSFWLEPDAADALVKRCNEPSPPVIEMSENELLLIDNWLKDDSLDENTRQVVRIYRELSSESTLNKCSERMGRSFAFISKHLKSYLKFGSFITCMQAVCWVEGHVYKGETKPKFLLTDEDRAQVDTICEKHPIIHNNLSFTAFMLTQDGITDASAAQKVGISRQAVSCFRVQFERGVKEGALRSILKSMIQRENTIANPVILKPRVKKLKKKAVKKRAAKRRGVKTTYEHIQLTSVSKDIDSLIERYHLSKDDG